MYDLPTELLNLLQNPKTTRTLATSAHDGTPDVVRRDALAVLPDGSLALPEELDSSQTSKNLVLAMWQDRRVALTIGNGNQAWHVIARPWRCVVAGPLFKQFLLTARAVDGPDADIAAVWILRPEAVRDDSVASQRAVELAQRPWAGAHMDCARFVRDAD